MKRKLLNHFSPFEFAFFPRHLFTAYPFHQHLTSPHLKKTPVSTLCCLTNNCGGAAGTMAVSELSLCWLASCYPCHH